LRPGILLEIIYALTPIVSLGIDEILAVKTDPSTSTFGLYAPRLLLLANVVK